MCETALFFIYHFEEFFTVSPLHVEYMAHFFSEWICCLCVFFGGYVFYLDVHVCFSIFMTRKKKMYNVSESYEDATTDSPMHSSC